jgi:hypothetical protein
MVQDNAGQGQLKAVKDSAGWSRKCRRRTVKISEGQCRKGKVYAGRYRIMQDKDW